MHKVEKELAKKTKIDEQDDGEDRQNYLVRLCEAVNTLEEDDWESMSEGAKAWANGATRAVKAEKDLPDFDDDKPAAKKAPAKAAPAAKGKPAAKATKEEAEEEEDPEDEVEDDGKPPAKKLPVKAKAPAADGKPRGLSAVAFVRQYVGTHPASDVAEITEALEKAGYNSLSRSSIGTIRSDFRSIARIIKDLGFLKKGVDLGV